MRLKSMRVGTRITQQKNGTTKSCSVFYFQKLNNLLYSAILQHFSTFKTSNCSKMVLRKALSLLFVIVLTVSCVQKEKAPKTFSFHNPSETENIVDALTYADMYIFNHHLGELEKEYSVSLITEEWKNRQLINSDTAFSVPLSSSIIENIGEHKKLPAKIRTKIEPQNDSTLFVTLSLNDTAKSFHLHLKETYDGIKYVPYFPIRYVDMTWQTNKNTPLVFYGSMWPDKEHGFYRFAHRSYLTGRENDDETGELLSSSPHYFIIACRVE